MKKYEFSNKKGSYCQVVDTIYTDGKVRTLRTEELTNFVRAYYTDKDFIKVDECEVGEFDTVPTAEEWWNGRLSMEECIWDDEVGCFYHSGRQPKYEGVIRHIGTPSWLRLPERLTQVNTSGACYVTLAPANGDFEYNIPRNWAKSKFPNMTREQFASALLQGRELWTDDWS